MNERFRGHVIEKVGKIGDKVFGPFLDYMDGEGEPSKVANVIGFSAGFLPATLADIDSNMKLAAEAVNPANTQYAVPGNQVHTNSPKINIIAAISNSSESNVSPINEGQSGGTLPYCDSHPDWKGEEDACYRLDKDKERVTIHGGSRNRNKEGQVVIQMGEICETLTGDASNTRCQQTIADSLIQDGVEFPIEGDVVDFGGTKIELKKLLKAAKAGFITTPNLRSTQASESIKEDKEEKIQDLIEDAGDSGEKCLPLVVVIIVLVASLKIKSNKNRNNQGATKSRPGDGSTLNTPENQAEYEARVAKNLANSPPGTQIKGPRAYLRK